MSKSLLLGASLTITLLTVFGLIGYTSYQASVSTTPTVAEVSLAENGPIDLFVGVDSPHSYLIPGQNNDLILGILTKEQATGLTAEFNYDPSKLQVNSVTQGEFFSNTLSTATIQNGKVKFTYVAPPDSGGVTGGGVIATLAVKPLATLPLIPLELTENTEAYTISQETNAIGPVAFQPLSAHLPADFNVDGVVNLADYNQFVTDYGTHPSEIIVTDITADGTIDLADYNQFVATYGQSY